MASLRPGEPSADLRDVSKQKRAAQPEPGGQADTYLPHTVPRSLSMGACALGHEEGELTGPLLTSEPPWVVGPGVLLVSKAGCLGAGISRAGLKNVEVNSAP